MSILKRKWSDAEKWFFGILASLITAVLIAAISGIFESTPSPEPGPSPERKPPQIYTLNGGNGVGQFNTGDAVNCPNGGSVDGVHQNGGSSNHTFFGDSEVLVDKVHAVVDGHQYSRVSVGGNRLKYNNHPAGFRLFTITITCNGT